MILPAGAKERLETKGQLVHTPPTTMCPPMHCLWIGPTSGGLGWLRKRVAAFRFCDRSLSVIERPIVDRAQLQDMVAAGLERIIVACTSRLDAPRELLGLFRDCCPEVPWAAACDSWWDGARRTGLRSPGYLTLPWYRWWDGWTAWLAGNQPTLFEPSPLDHAVLPFQTRQPVPTSSPTASIATESRLGWVVGNCRQSLQAWSLAAAACGHTAETYSVERYSKTAIAQRRGAQSNSSQQDSPQQNSTQRPLWVLWDDSSSDTVHGYRPDELQMVAFFTALQRSQPQALAIAAVGLPRVDILDHLSRCHPQFEFFVKPSSGCALAQLLELATLRRSTLRVESPPL